MLAIYLVFLILATKNCLSQDEDGPYRGKFIGKLNSYHHQVSGDVYAVDDRTILLVHFNYDGAGADAFFWAGDSGRVGPQGFIVPDEHGKTNVLERYFDATIRLTLPDGKSLRRVSWLAVYDIGSQNAFADVDVPEDFEPPAPVALGPLIGTDVTGTVIVNDSSTILVKEFSYLGGGSRVHFTCGVGPQPSRKGAIIADQYGYFEPLDKSQSSELRLQLPSDTSILDVDWLSLYDVERGASLGDVLVPDELNVPASGRETSSYRSSLTSCRQLHSSLQVSWEVFGNAITIQLAGQLLDNEYMSFGISASSPSRMLGADVAVVRYDPVQQRAHVVDYNISAMAPCVQVLGQWQGVCRDDRIGHTEGNQLLSASKVDDLTVVTYRRNLKPVDSIDLEWAQNELTNVVWAVGPLDHLSEPGLHTLYPLQDLTLNISERQDDCRPFVIGSRPPLPRWETPALFEPSLRSYKFSLGPRGGRPGPSALLWYVNGLPAPDLQLARGLTYSFQIFGGNDPHSATLYHPLVVTTSRGGWERLSEKQQDNLTAVLGLQQSRRGRRAAAFAGPLCLGTVAPHSRPELAPRFSELNRSVTWSCAPGAPSEMQLTPAAHWPDLLYYQSFTHTDMGGRIFVVDRHKRHLGRRGAAPHTPPTPALLFASLAAACLRSLLC